MKQHALPVTILLLILILGSSHPLPAQEENMIWPPELYAGENVVTIRLRNGIRSIRITHTPNVEVEGTGEVGCAPEHNIRVRVLNAQQATLSITMVDCRNRSFNGSLNVQDTWNTDQISYGRVEAGDTVCREFQIRLDPDLIGGLGPARTLDSITASIPNVILKLPRRPPLRISQGSVFRYQVCFIAERPGTYRFPITTWMRRDYFSGGLTTYPVADTGVAVVIPRRERVPPPPPDTTRPPDTARFTPPPPIVEEPVTDPTTFRSIVVPNAIIPKGGTSYAGVYDLLGLTAGHALSDHLMLIAGGALPTPDDWGGIRGEMFGAYSIGLKGGISLGDELDLAAGYQWGRSIYDKEETPDTLESRITVNAPYVAVSYGNNDNRLSATFGYAFKRHVKPGLEFDQNAMITAFGGDYRIGRHWKLAGELITMESLGVVPIVATLRYFSNSYALDFGVSYVGITTGDAKPPAIPLVPVISALVVF